MYFVLAAFIVSVVVLDLVLGAASRKPARSIYDISFTTTDD